MPRPKKTNGDLTTMDTTALNINPNQDVTPAPLPGRLLIPTWAGFTALWQIASRTYLSRYKDQATRDSMMDALAMRRDTFICSLLRARRSRILDADYCIDVEDPNDKKQVECGEKIDKLIRTIPRFAQMKDSLLESDFFGIAGSQMTWNYKKVDKKEYLVPVDHQPVQGDKIIPSWTPNLYGILVYRGFNPEGATILPVDSGSLLMLDRPDFRDQFVFMRFKTQDKDYQFESDLAGNAVGVGLRSELYWYYILRRSVLEFIITSFQRISTSGLLYGKFPLGNPAAEAAMSNALVQLNRDGVCLVPVDPEHPELTAIESIEPSSIANDALKTMLEYFDGTMTRVVLGQTLTSTSESLGIGGGASEIQEDTLQAIVNSDAQNLGECLTEDLIEPLRRYNPELQGEFKVSIRFMLRPTKITERLEAAKVLFEMGIALDEQQLLDLAGLKGADERDPKQKLVKKSDMMEMESQLATKQGVDIVKAKPAPPKKPATKKKGK
jgi:uncharacterized protein DUF935